VLCPRAVFDVTSTIAFTADDQEILSEGLPSGADRAVLQIASKSISAAINGKDRSRIALRSIVVDGGHRRFGKAVDALITIGGDASGQVIDGIDALQARGWTHLHLWEGVQKTCTGAVVRNSRFGPSGGDRLTDGISLACRNSTVEGNTIVDATDGGIVIFQAPGSSVHANTVRAERLTLQGGIAMVDYDPFGGDLSGTVVDANTIDAAGARIAIGIAMGPRVWNAPWCSSSRMLRGGSVTNNALTGSFMGYGLAASGVDGWTVTGNTVDATVWGTPGLACGGGPPLRPFPGPFLKDPARARGTFQPEFVDAPTLDNILQMNPSISSRLRPNGVAFPPGTASVTLDWDPVSGATAYYVVATDAIDPRARDPRNDCRNNTQFYLCLEKATVTTISLPVTGGHLYSWGVAPLFGSRAGDPESAGFYVEP
jgi:hypothetical protein